MKVVADEWNVPVANNRICVVNAPVNHPFLYKLTAPEGEFEFLDDEGAIVPVFAEPGSEPDHLNVWIKLEKPTKYLYLREVGSELEPFKAFDLTTACAEAFAERVAEVEDDMIFRTPWYKKLWRRLRRFIKRWISI